MLPLPAPSLRRKITLGYIAIGVLIVALALLAYGELRRMEGQIESGSRIAEFLNVVLEIRRYEKNFFLYQKHEELQENLRWQKQAGELIRQPPPAFAPVSPERWWELQAQLARYGQAMTAYVDACETSEYERQRGEERVRQVGKGLVTAAETMAALEKEQLFASLERHRQILLAAIVMLALFLLVAGSLLSRAVNQPLQAMEAAMRRVAEGHMGPVELPFRDQEFQSLILAFNRMLGELHSRQKHLVRSEKLASLGTMLSGVAHELNNPLSNIATSCQILLEEPHDDPFHQELLHQIDGQTMRARHIVRSLLDFARDRPFRQEPVLLDALLEETLRLMRSQIPLGVHVTRQVGPGVAVLADSQRLQQALLNIVKNGVDAMGEQGELTIHVNVIAECPDLDLPLPHRLVAGNTARCRHRPVVLIAVQDSGPGIDPAILPRILDPFFSTKETGKGSGLGLFITYEIVEEHGGCLLVDSAAGQGTAVQLFLPQSPEQDPRP